MAKTTTTVVEDVPASEKADVIEEDVLRALVELDSGSDVRWQIIRTSGVEGERGYCGTMATIDLTQENIAEKYGPGKYQVKGIRQNGTYFKSGHIEVSKSAIPPKMDSSKDLLNSLQGKNSSDDMFKFMTLMMSMQQEASKQMTSVLTALISKPSESKGFPIEALIAASPALLGGLKEFFSTGKTDPMKQMLDAITITEKLRGKGDGNETGATWIDIVRDGLQSVPALLSGRAGQTPAVASATVLPGVKETTTTPIPLAHVETPEAVASGDPGEEDVNLKLLIEFKGKLSMLIERAKKMRDPQTYAEVFLDELPDGIDTGLIVNLLNSDDWFMRLKGFDSRVEPYEEWFTQFRDIVLYQLSGEEDDEPIPADRRTRITPTATAGETSDDTDAEVTDA